MKIMKREKNDQDDVMEIENFWYNGSTKNFSSRKISISFFPRSFSENFRSICMLMMTIVAKNMNENGKL